MTVATRAGGINGAAAADGAAVAAATGRRRVRCVVRVRAAVQQRWRDAIVSWSAARPSIALGHAAASPRLAVEALSFPRHLCALDHAHTALLPTPHAMMEPPLLADLHALFRRPASPLRPEHLMLSATTTPVTAAASTTPRSLEHILLRAIGEAAPLPAAPLPRLDAHCAEILTSTTPIDPRPLLAEALAGLKEEADAAATLRAHCTSHLLLAPAKLLAAHDAWCVAHTKPAAEGRAAFLRRLDLQVRLRFTVSNG